MEEIKDQDNKRSVRIQPSGSPPRASRTLHSRQTTPEDEEIPPALSRGNVYAPRASHVLHIPPLADEPGDRSKDGMPCCGTRCNTRLISFFTKTSISVLVLIFCFFKLWYQPECQCSDDSAVYISILSSVLSFFVGHNIRQ